MNFVVGNSIVGYYPFGQIQPGRSFTSNSYRFGFNGMEKENEISGVDGGHLDFGARIYDSRLGRWLSIDPLAKIYPEFSPYNFALNSPIQYKDIGGEGVNGGFSVSNQSDQPVIILGTSLTTEDKGIFSNESYNEGDQVAITLQPGQRFEATYKTYKKDGVTIEEFNGRIVDIKTGEVVKENVGIYDVDFIKIQDDQTFEDNNGETYTNKDTDNVEGGQGQVKLGSPIMDAIMQNGGAKLGIEVDPDPDDRNEGNVNVKTNSKGNLKLETTGQKENQPNISYGSKKKI